MNPFDRVGVSAAFQSGSCLAQLSLRLPPGKSNQVLGLLHLHAGADMWERSVGANTPDNDNSGNKAFHHKLVQFRDGLLPHCGLH